MPYRTDVKIVRRRSPRNPSLSTIGYDKYWADPGDLLLYKEHYEDGTHSERLARYIGMVEPKPGALEPEKARGKLCVIAMGETMDHAYERWIAMKDIVRIVPSPPATRLVQWFFGPFAEWPNPSTVRRWAGDGYLTPRFDGKGGIAWDGIGLNGGR